MPEFYMIRIPEKVTKYPNFYDFCPKKINVIPEFYMHFARKVPEFYIIIPPKNIFPNWGKGTCRPPAPPRLPRLWKFLLFYV